MAPTALTVTENVTVQKKAFKSPVTQRTVWKKVIQIIVLHTLAIYGLLLLVTGTFNFKLFMISYVYGTLGGLGITAGAHRLWSHRSYKAKLPLRIFLMLMNCVALQGDIYKWSRDHRVHHKFTDTDADPYNAKRGFFFSHVGWLLVEKHPEVISKGKGVDFSDILADPVVRFQIKHYALLSIGLSLVLPTCLVAWLGNETLWKSFLVAGAFRYCMSLHYTWLVNSAAHMWGYRPYDHHITPRENLLVSLASNGEGFHNYHHAFPWDYATSEYGIKWNLTTGFLNLMATFGQAYDLRSASSEMIHKRKLRTGELSNESVKTRTPTTFS